MASRRFTGLSSLGEIPEITKVEVDVFTFDLNETLGKEEKFRS